MDEAQLQRLQTKIVDTREPGTIRQELLSLGWVQRALTTGDYHFFSYDWKKVGIERKSVDDFLGSQGDKLNRQLEQSLDYYNYVVLLIEGSWRSVSAEDNIVSGRGIERSTWRSVWNYLLSWEAKGVMIQLTVNEGHTIKRVGELYAFFQRPVHTTGKSKEFSDDRVMAFPSGCRGQTAIDVLETFDSLENVCKCQVKDFMMIPGIGQKKAALIYNHFHKKTNTENNKLSTDELIKEKLKELDTIDKNNQVQTQSKMEL